VLHFVAQLAVTQGNVFVGQHAVVKVAHLHAVGEAQPVLGTNY
jgi:hypothetical protein